MTPTIEQVLSTLGRVRYPGKQGSIVELQMVSASDISIDGKQVSVVIHFPKPKDPFAKSVTKSAETALLTFLSDELDVQGRIVGHFPEAPTSPQEEPLLSGVKNVVAVFSGKGGVGKSTVTANLAVALAQLGYRVGLLDADIYGPSMPKMFGCEDARPVLIEVDGKEKIAPEEVAYGIKLLSIGFFVDPKQALMWRGTLAANALQQLIRDGHWGELDYLLLDMPPGTGDIHLTLVQSIAITGAIVVTTPQQVAVVDAQKGISMFQTENINVPVLGLIENMSWFTPAELPQNKYYIFGNGGGKQLAQELGVDLLAQIPLVQSVCEAADHGAPIASQSDHMLHLTFENLALKVVKAVDNRRETLPPTHVVQMRHEEK